MVDSVTQKTFINWYKVKIIGKVIGKLMKIYIWAFYSDTESAVKLKLLKPLYNTSYEGCLAMSFHTPPE